MGVNRYLSRALVVGVILAAGLALTGCGPYTTRQTEQMAPDEAWNLAKGYFDVGNFSKAQVEFDAFVKNYRHKADSTQVRTGYFLLALSSYRGEDWLTARADFSYFLSRGGPVDSLAEKAAYYYGMTFYETAPGPELDQTDTDQAVQILKELLARVKVSNVRDSVQSGLGLCYEKLSRKNFVTARLYYNTHDYAAAVIYADAIIENYAGTTWYEPAILIKAQSYMEMNNLEKARDPLEYLVRYGKDKDLADDARTLLAEIGASSGSH